MGLSKKSFVMTGYVQRSTCNCGCISNNVFWQDGGIGGSSYLSHLHRGIEKHLDELSGAKEGETGKACDIKVTVTIEELGKHDHRIVNRHSFSGLGCKDNKDLKEKILEEGKVEEETNLNGEEEFGDQKTRQARVKKLFRELSVAYLQDMHDKLLLAKRTEDWSKLDELMDSIQIIVQKED
jgi:hypothetical protein